MRINLGTQASVSASDQWLTYVKAGQAFNLGVLQAAVAAALGQIQLLNPVASGKTVLVRSLILEADVNSPVDIAEYDTALVTDAGAGRNLLRGGAAAVAHVRQQTSAALVGTVAYNSSILASSPFRPVDNWFYILAPGNGLVAQGEAANIAVRAYFQWAEY